MGEESTTDLDLPLLAYFVFVSQNQALWPQSAISEFEATRRSTTPRVNCPDFLIPPEYPHGASSLSVVIVSPAVGAVLPTSVISAFEAKLEAINVAYYFIVFPLMAISIWTGFGLGMFLADYFRNSELLFVGFLAGVALIILIAIQYHRISDRMLQRVLDKDEDSSFLVPLPDFLSKTIEADGKSSARRDRLKSLFAGPAGTIVGLLASAMAGPLAGKIIELAASKGAELVIDAAHQSARKER